MTALLLTLHLVVAPPATAAESIHQNLPWSAFYGCWQAEGAPANELVCIGPVTGGVRLATLVDGAVRAESRIIADGIARAVQQPGCQGTERARWSSDGQRVFLDSDIACPNLAPRNVRGMFAFVAPDEWVSVQTAAQGDSVATRVVRFRAAAGIPAGAASLVATRTLSDAVFEVDESDVAEAVEQIGAAAAQEWMRAAGEPFQLAYRTQEPATSSALEQVGRMSNPVVVQEEVERVVEQPVYVHNTYIVDRYWDYSPWGYHYHGWHWFHRPLFVVHWPIVIHRNHYYRSGWYRGRYGYQGDRDRRDRDRNRGGRVTRDGYSNGRDRDAAAPAPNRARTDLPRSTEPSVIRQATQRTPRETVETRPRSNTTSRASAPRSATTRTNAARGTTSRASSARSTPSTRSTPSRGTTTRTARARGSSN